MLSTPNCPFRAMSKYPCAEPKMAFSTVFKGAFLKVPKILDYLVTDKSNFSFTVISQKIAKIPRYSKALRFSFFFSFYPFSFFFSLDKPVLKDYL
jgi:hypothetical protein